MKPKSAPIIDMLMAPTEFLVAAQDTKGHSASVHFRIQPGTVRDIEVFLSEYKHKFGWSTASDFHRWAVKNALERAAKIAGDGKLSDAMEIKSIVDEMVADKLIRVQWTESMDQVAQTVERLSNAGMRDEAVRLLGKVKGKLRNMTDKRWQKRYEELFDERFGRLLKGVSLVDSEE